MVTNQRMEKGKFIYFFFTKKIVLLFLGEEILSFSKEHPKDDPLSIPLEWYNEANDIWTKRILN
jgi:hypothetical protein